MKINIAVAATLDKWVVDMGKIIHKSAPEVNLGKGKGGMLNYDDSAIITLSQADEMLKGFKAAGYKVDEFKGSKSASIYSKESGYKGVELQRDPPEAKGKASIFFFDKHDDEDFESESSDLVATAAKSPSAAQLKKAAAVLKKAKAAKSDKLNDNLDALLADATALHKEADAAKRMNDAQVEKLRAQIDKLETKAENAYLRAAGKVKKVIDRAAKQMARMDKAGVKYTVPKVLASYFNLPAKSATKDDATDESLDSPAQLKKRIANLETSLKAVQGKKSKAAMRIRITKQIAALKEKLAAAGKKTKRPSAE